MQNKTPRVNRVMKARKRPTRQWKRDAQSRPGPPFIGPTSRRAMWQSWVPSWRLGPTRHDCNHPLLLQLTPTAKQDACNKQTRSLLSSLPSRSRSRLATQAKQPSPPIYAALSAPLISSPTFFLNRTNLHCKKQNTAERSITSSYTTSGAILALRSFRR